MQKAIIGKKVGMTQIFDENGHVIPVTVIEAGPCVVAQKKTIEMMADAIEMTSGRAKCRATRAISTSTVVITACRMPTVLACLPMLSNTLSRNSLPMTKAMKPSATCVMMP